MSTQRYEIPEEARGRRLYARRYVRRLNSQMPYHASFLSKRRRMADRDNLRLVQLMAMLAMAEQPVHDLVAA